MLCQKRFGPAVIGKGCGEVHGRDRIVVDDAGTHSRAAHDQRNTKKPLVMHRPLQHQPVITKPVAMVGGIDNNRVVGETEFVKAGHQPANLMVNQGDLAIGVGDDLTKLFVALLRNAAVILANAGKVGIAGRFRG